MKTHLGFRASPQLQAAITAVGETSAAARALIILGLVAAGADVAQLQDEAAAALPDLTDPGVREALRSVVFNTRSTPVTHAPPPLRLIERVEPAPTTPDLWAIGVEV